MPPGKQWGPWDTAEQALWVEEFRIDKSDDRNKICRVGGERSLRSQRNHSHVTRTCLFLGGHTEPPPSLWPDWRHTTRWTSRTGNILLRLAISKQIYKRNLIIIEYFEQGIANVRQWQARNEWDEMLSTEPITTMSCGCYIARSHIDFIQSK